MFILIIILFVFFFITIKMLNTTKTEIEDKYQILNKTNAELEKEINRIENFFSCFFSSNELSYHDAYLELFKLLETINKKNNKLDGMTKQYYSKKIQELGSIINEFKIFADKINALSYINMMSDNRYGEVNKQYLSSIRNFSKSEIDAIIFDYSNRLCRNNYQLIFQIDLEKIILCIWFYAFENYFSENDFQKAVNIFLRLYRKSHLDIVIARLYILKRLGGEEAVRNKINNILKYNNSSKKLIFIASSLMWMKEYGSELIILQHMLSKGIRLSEKAQERLHFLSNNGGNHPNSFNVSSSNNMIYFDVSSLTWSDDEYLSFFSNLDFHEKKLTYSLAIRDVDEALPIIRKIKLLTTDVIYKKAKDYFYTEYNKAVSVNIKNCKILLENCEEEIKGILLIVEQYKQMGVFVNVVQIGNNINIKFYTLFIPVVEEIDLQRKQVFSLLKKLNPSITLWENSLKNTMLDCIQQILNYENDTIFNKKNFENKEQIF